MVSWERDRGDDVLVMGEQSMGYSWKNPRRMWELCWAVVSGGTTPIHGVKPAGDAPRRVRSGVIGNAISAPLAGCVSPRQVCVPAPPRLHKV